MTMTRTIIRTCLGLAVLSLPIVATAADKQDAARQLLEKSYRQANIWSQAPIQFGAEITLPQGKKPALQLTYKISWAGPNRWRAEWSGSGYSRIVVVNNGKIFRSSSNPVPPSPVLEFERSLGTLTGHGFTGPTAAIPNLNGMKIESSSEKFGKSRAECVRAKNIPGELCMDPGSAQALAWKSDESRFEYSDYAPVGSAFFPREIHQSANGASLLEGRISVTVPADLPLTLFAAPAGATEADYPTCTNDSPTLRGSTLEKKVTPEYPQNAKAARHQGNVFLYAIVGKDGSIETLKPITASWPELETSAMNAVKEWKYSPYLLCGQPVEMEMVISVNYSLF
jgi:TonB family protein